MASNRLAEHNHALQQEHERISTAGSDLAIAAMRFVAMLNVYHPEIKDDLFVKDKYQALNTAISEWANLFTPSKEGGHHATK